MRKEHSGFREPMGSGAAADIVWPLPATDEAVREIHEFERQKKERQERQREQAEANAEWQQSINRQSRVDAIMAFNWGMTGPCNYKIHGRPLEDCLTGGSTNATLTQLLMPRQLITGDEPEDLTFELPIRYSALTNFGALFLVVDAEMDGPVFCDAGGRLQELRPSTNGNCCILWHTIFDPPGRHAVQVIFLSDKDGEFGRKGPPVAVTTSNLCQFSLDSATFNQTCGATFHARLPESNGIYSIECLTTNGEHLKTISGTTSNGEFNVDWDLVDDHGRKRTEESFSSKVQITLPDSGHSQTLRGP